MKKPIYTVLYFQVICAIICGVTLGYFFPEIGASMKPLGDAFIKLIKMIIAPVIFCTVVTGIAGMKDMKKVGKRVEDAGKKMEKFGRKLDRGNEAEPKEDNNTNASNEDGNEAQK